MQIVTGDSALTQGAEFASETLLDSDEVCLLLQEMAAVTRTIFGVAVAATPTVVVPAPATPAPPAQVPLPVTSLPVPQVSIPIPVLAVDPIDPAERHSLALLQEIAFLDD